MAVTPRLTVPEHTHEIRHFIPAAATEYQTDPNIALVSYFMCAKTDKEARRRADGVTFFQFALRYYTAAAGRERAQPGTVSLWTASGGGVTE